MMSREFDRFFYSPLITSHHKKSDPHKYVMQMKQKVKKVIVNQDMELRVLQWLASLHADPVVMASLTKLGGLEILNCAPKSKQSNLGTGKRSWEIKATTMILTT